MVWVTFQVPPGKLSFWRETSQSLGTLIVDRPTNDQQPMTNDQQPTAEELNYSSNRAWRHQHPTNNLLEVCKNLAIFGGRPIGNAVEELLTIVINLQSSYSSIGFVFVAPRRTAGSLLAQSNGAESIILSGGGAETIMLSAHAESITLSAPPTESIIVSVPPAESMILSASPAEKTLRHGASMMHRALK